MNSPLREGSYAKSVVQGDWRAIASTGDMRHLMFGMTNTNDRGVLMRYPTQVNMLQAGWTGQGYQVLVGDVFANLSGLGSSLALRGITGQKQFGEFALSGHAGVVTESWEALQNLTPRMQYLREVSGIKVERGFGDNLRIFATAQSYRDREDSLGAGLYAAAAARVRSLTAGFAFQEGRLAVAGETAGSRYADAADNDRRGRASVIDGTYRFDTVGLRAGFHRIDPAYASLSLAVPAGVREAYFGGDWFAADWLVLGADARSSKTTTLAIGAWPSQTTISDSATLRATINYGAELPGWSTTLQYGAIRGKDAYGNPNRSGNAMAALNYSSPTWLGALSVSRSRLENEAYPSSDSTTTTYQGSIGRNFSDANDLVPASWTLGINAGAALQAQKLDVGAETRNTNFTLSVTAAKNGLGHLNLTWNSGMLTRPYGATDLRIRGLQLDAVKPLGGQNSVKLYIRDQNRNLGDRLLATRERVIGIQLAYNF